LSELLLVGRVARAHGNKGQVIVNSDTDFPADRFAEGNVLVVEQAGQQVERRIVSVRFQQGRPILALDGVQTMDDAEALAGAELKVPAAGLAPLPDQTYYRHDLIGCEVRTKHGQVVGTVTEVEGPLERSLLVVAGKRGEVMIPMVDGIVVEVDPVARRVVVDPPAGLLDLTTRAPASARSASARSRRSLGEGGSDSE
jgi:16S rRNA processing protein RimM